MSTNVPRNELCPCGSGKKYKKCCLAADEKSRREASALEAASRVEPKPETRGRTLPSAEDNPAADANVGKGATSPELVKTEADLYADRLWERFLALDEPSPAELSEILSELAALPADEEMSWNDIFRQCASWKSCEWESVFRQIASTVPHSKVTSMGFFYWCAAEMFSDRKAEYGHLLEEVISGFRRLDVDSYDFDALDHTLRHLLDAGCLDGALKLAEEFLPVVKEDPELLDWVLPDYCRDLFELRLGRALRDHRAGSEVSPEDLTRELCRDLEDEVPIEVALAAARVVTSQGFEGNEGCDWSRAAFTLVAGNISGNDDSWDAGVTLFTSLVRVARECWQIDQEAPERSVPALSFFLKSAYEWNQKARKNKNKKKKEEVRANLLDYLQPSGMEKRIAEAAAGFFRIDPVRARLLLSAHGILNRTALRHDFVSAEEAEKTDLQLLRLNAMVAGLSSGTGK